LEYPLWKDHDSNLTGVALPNGKSLSFVVDQHNRVTHKEWATGKYWDLAYDNQAVNGMGRLVGASGPEGSFSYSYDVRGNLLADSATVVESGTAYTTTRSYNLANLPATLTYPGGGIQIQLVHSYNPDGSLKQLTQGTFCIEGTYTPGRKPETITASLDCGVREDMAYSFDYDACDRLYHFVSQSLYPQSLLVLERTYQFFDNDKIKAIDDNGQHFDLTYDGAGRLQSIAGGLNISYTHDTADRITNINRGGVNTPRYFNDSRFPWATTQVGASLVGTYLTYDAAGYLTTRTKTLQPTYTEVYDARGLLSSSSVSNSPAVHQWIYDPAEHLLNLKKTQTPQSGTNFIGKIYEHDYLAAKERWYYHFNGQRIALRDQAGAYQFFHPDQIQSVRFVTGPSGNVISRHKYEPFGPEVDTLEGDLTKRAFNDRRKEGYKSLSRFPARMYDAWTHQWTALDPKALTASPSLLLESGINPYAYCSNDPINRHDPTGSQDRMGMLPTGLTNTVDLDAFRAHKVGRAVFSLAKWVMPDPSREMKAAGELGAALKSGDKEAVKQIITGVVVGAVVAGIVKGVVDRSDNDKSQTDDPDKAKGKLSKKERREAERARSREAKHGDPDWEEPASESYVKNLGKKAERDSGKDARREGHDAKEAGEGDRSKRQSDEDYGPEK